MHDDSLDNMFDTDDPVFSDDANDDLAFEDAEEKEPVEDTVKDEDSVKENNTFGDDDLFDDDESFDNDEPEENARPEESAVAEENAKEQNSASDESEDDSFHMPDSHFDEDEGAFKEPEDVPEFLASSQEKPAKEETPEKDDNPEAEFLVSNDEEPAEDVFPEDSEEDMQALKEHEEGDDDNYSEEPVLVSNLDVVTHPVFNIWKADPVMASIDIPISAEGDEEFIFGQIDKSELMFDLYRCDSTGKAIGHPVPIKSVSSKDCFGYLVSFEIPIEDPGATLGEKENDCNVQKYVVIERIPKELQPVIRVLDNVRFDVVVTREFCEGGQCLTGAIKAEVRVPDEKSRFVNVLRYQPVHVHFKVPKVSAFGIFIEPSEFRFVLSGDGIQNHVVNALPDGSVDFGEITIREAGTYHFQIRQEAPDDPDDHLTYDLKPQDIVLDVTPIGSTLSVSRQQ